MFKKIPHTFVIIFILIFVACVATWFVSAGEFVREPQVTESGKIINGIVSGSYHKVEQQPQTWEIMSAFFKGFQKVPAIIAFLLVIGGSFWILNETKAIDIGVNKFLVYSKRLERYAVFRFVGVNNIVIVFIMMLFSLFGAVFGMSEETIAFVAVFVPLAISMGYDSIVGVCMCFLAAGLGFAGCILNPFTLGIAQDIAGIKMFSGIEYRFIIWMIVTFTGIGFVLWYAKRIKRNPKKSVVYESDNFWRKQHEEQAAVTTEQQATKRTWIAYIITSLAIMFYTCKAGFADISENKGFVTYIFMLLLALIFVVVGYKSVRKSVQRFCILLLAYTVIYLIAGVMLFEWGFTEIVALFFMMGVVAAMSMNRTASDIAKLFIAGAKDMLSAALVVGLASGIIVILEDGRIIDTFLNAVAVSVGNTGRLGSLSLMYGFQSLLNAIITSGTAKAAMLMPMFREIGLMTGISLQSVVTAFHIGDGITNLITPTSGVLIGVLAVAKIDYVKWVKFSWKFILAMVILGWLLLIPTLYLTLPDF